MTRNKSIHGDTIMSAPDHVLARKAVGETVLLSLADDHYYSLDGVGSFFWELLKTGTTFGEAVSTVAAAYEVDIATLSADLECLIEDLLRSDLVRTS